MKTLEIIFFIIVLLTLWVVTIIQQEQIKDLETEIDIIQSKIHVIKYNDEINKLKHKLKAYQYKLDDLSISYINHFGEYPRRIIDENRKRN